MIVRFSWSPVDVVAQFLATLTHAPFPLALLLHLVTRRVKPKSERHVRYESKKYTFRINPKQKIEFLEK